jgi:nucleotide-binding universal stress UspA family protein
MFNKVLVPLDGSELAERALDPALAIVRARNAELLLLSVPSYHHVVAPAAAGYGLTAIDQIVDLGQDDANDYLDALCREARCGDCRIQTMVVQGDVAGCIVDTAAAEGVDLIVMTTHGYSGFTRWMLGSIAERVLRGASCPVLVVRQAIPLCKALIALDGSSLSQEALMPGLELARLLGCQTSVPSSRVCCKWPALGPARNWWREPRTGSAITWNAWLAGTVRLNCRSRRLFF